MPLIASAAFLIVFANLAGAPDLTQPHGGRGTRSEPTMVLDTVRACAPGPDFCADLHRECSSADVSLANCDKYEELCATDPCAACEAAIDRCEASSDSNCDYLAAHCGAGLAGCCEPKRPEPSDTIRGCAPDVDLCTQLSEACAADGMDEQGCDDFGKNICPEDRYTACKGLQAVCEAETGSACAHLEETCEENLNGCAAPACEHAGTLSPGTAVAFCFAYPARLDGCGEEPDVGLCLELMTWKECRVTTCEWADCMDALAAIGDKCPMFIPQECKAIEACRAAEDSGAW